MATEVTFPSWVILALAIGVPTATLVARTWIIAWLEARAKSTFDRQLESHKTDLQLVTEAARFDYQRRIHDFALYSARKHAANARLYRYLVEAEGRVSDVLPQEFKYAPTFSDFNENDLEEFLKEQDFPSGKRAELLAVFRESRQRAVEAFLTYRVDIQRWKAQKARGRATRYFLFNALYLSNEVTDRTEKVLVAFQQIIVDAQMGQNEITARALGMMRTVHDELKRIKSAMQVELAAGYYSSSAEIVTAG